MTRKTCMCSETVPGPDTRQETAEYWEITGHWPQCPLLCGLDARNKHTELERIAEAKHDR